jgi:small GTP-binding protein
VESIIEQKQEIQRSTASDELALSLSELKARFGEQGDFVTAQKMGELEQKWQQKEFVLAFCGHFSAGKSTMINTLMGSEILPSSPIPTSANVVKIKTGNPPRAMAYFRDQPPASFDYMGDLERLKDYCKDGDEVVSVEISYPNHFLVNQACLLDTPGIDSTDAAHKVATESAIHLADTVVYMMDYNHVLSELNFQFAKLLKEQGKTLILVVNQIDKHFEMELSFEQFEQTVEDSFHQWGIEPDGFYYTTLKLPTHPKNQLKLLHDRLYSLFWKKDELLKNSVVAAARQLISEHQTYLRAKQQKQREEWNAKVAGADEQQVITEAGLLQDKIAGLEKIAPQFDQQARGELFSLLENANLTPFSTRELAAKFLESSQPGFKVGLLFSGGKTKQEIENRKEAFLNELKEQVKVNLEFHLKQSFTQWLDDYQIKDQTQVRESIEAIHFELTPEYLLTHLKIGAKVTGDSVLNFCKELSNDIKLHYRKLSLNCLEEFLSRIEEDSLEKINAYKQTGSELLALQEVFSKIQNAQHRENEYIGSLIKQLEQAALEVHSAETAEPQRPIPERTWQDQNTSLISRQEVGTLVLEAEQTKVSVFKKDYKAKLQRAAERLESAAALLERMSGQALAVKSMRARANRLTNNLFTVALFGAFSAGKSSFANALMGDMVLPVSPNPTTATINKILPPTAEFPHGSVRVKLKNQQEMTKDVLYSLSIFHLNANSIEEAISKIDRININEVLPSAKPHYTFLKAVEKGLSFFQGKFGEELLVGLTEFKELVAREEKACYVEWIELYYSCAFTDQGISLVDTPGADSINARHTGVAFDYIKNADAVLFVTYYNHAFSHADQEFLEQLGRVKDTFEMDKMFFIVNAADLARSRDELIDVVEHVKDNLISCGIRGPRLYPVSSQTALLARMLQEGELSESAKQIYQQRTGKTDSLMPPVQALEYSGFQAFENDFIQFTIEELTEVAIQAGTNEILRAQAALQSMIKMAAESEEKRNEKREELVCARGNDIQLISSCSPVSEQPLLEKEVEELLYYVKQRISFKLGEWFALAFNPAILQDDKGKQAKQMVGQCFDEYVRHVTFNLGQEIRATSLRLEKYCNQSAQKIYTQLIGQLSAEIDEPYMEASQEVPDIPEQIAADFSSSRHILSQFKNPKQFFEQGGRDSMNKALEQWILNPISQFVLQCQQILKDSYGRLLEKNVSLHREKLMDKTKEYYEGMNHVLGPSANLHEMKTIHEKLGDLTCHKEVI